MIRALEPLVDLWILTRADNPRAAEPVDLAREVRQGLLASPVRCAVEIATLLARPSDRVLVTGSFYVAGEALAVLRIGMRSDHSAKYSFRRS